MYVQRKYVPEVAFYYTGGDDKQLKHEVSMAGGSAQLNSHGQMMISVFGQRVTLLPGFVAVGKQGEQMRALRKDAFDREYDIVGDTYTDPATFRQEMGEALDNLSDQMQGLNDFLFKARNAASGAKGEADKAVQTQMQVNSDLSSAIEDLTRRFDEAAKQVKADEDQIRLNSDAIGNARTHIERAFNYINELRDGDKDFMTLSQVRELGERLSGLETNLDNFHRALENMSMDAVKSVQKKVEAVDETLAGQRSAIDTLDEEMQGVSEGTGFAVDGLLHLRYMLREALDAVESINERLDKLEGKPEGTTPAIEEWPYDADEAHLVKVKDLTGGQFDRLVSDYRNRLVPYYYSQESKRLYKVDEATAKQLFKDDVNFGNMEIPDDIAIELGAKEAPAEVEEAEESEAEAEGKEPAQESEKPESEGVKKYSDLTREQAQKLIDAWKKTMPAYSTTVAKVLEDKSAITEDDQKILDEQEK